MTTPTWIEPPPRHESGGMGCFAKGCLILVVFLLVLAGAFVFGTVYAVRHLRTSLLAPTSVALAPNNSTSDEQQMALAKWKIFERSARAHAPARIEMTAEELNALIASEPKLRDRAFVSIENDIGRVQVSFQLTDVPWLRGSYVNGECVVRPSANGDPDRATVTDVVLNGHSIDDVALTWRYPFSLRRFISEWTEQNDLKTFQIRDGKVILETRGANVGETPSGE
jgi:hypothetical protein